MAAIITRELGPTAKNAPLINAEIDANFININDQMLTQADQIVAVAEAADTNALVMSIALG